MIMGIPKGNIQNIEKTERSRTSITEKKIFDKDKLKCTSNSFDSETLFAPEKTILSLDATKPN